MSLYERVYNSAKEELASEEAPFLCIARSRVPRQVEVMRTRSNIRHYEKECYRRKRLNLLNSVFFGGSAQSNDPACNSYSASCTTELQILVQTV